MKDPTYRKEYNALDEEFSIVAAIARRAAAPASARPNWRAG
jgi:hypothetical protein